MTMDVKFISKFLNDFFSLEVKEPILYKDYYKETDPEIFGLEITRIKKIFSEDDYVALIENCLVENIAKLNILVSVLLDTSNQRYVFKKLHNVDISELDRRLSKIVVSEEEMDIRKLQKLLYVFGAEESFLEIKLSEVIRTDFDFYDFLHEKESIENLCIALSLSYDNAVLKKKSVSRVEVEYFGDEIVTEQEELKYEELVFLKEFDLKILNMFGFDLFKLVKVYNSEKLRELLKALDSDIAKENVVKIRELNKFFILEPRKLEKIFNFSYTPNIVFDFKNFFYPGLSFYWIKIFEKLEMKNMKYGGLKKFALEHPNVKKGFFDVEKIMEVVNYNRINEKNYLEIRITENILYNSEKIKNKNKKIEIQDIEYLDFPYKEWMLDLFEGLKNKSKMKWFIANKFMLQIFTPEETMVLIEKINEKEIINIILENDLKKFTPNNILKKIIHPEKYKTAISNTDFEIIERCGEEELEKERMEKLFKENEEFFKSLKTKNIGALILKNKNKIFDFFFEKDGTMITKNTDTKKMAIIFKAFVLDKLDELKFGENFLQEEIGLELNKATVEAWKNNLSTKKAFESYDFYDSLNIGRTPVKTCLNYDGGLYRQTLLSMFDANKKILFAGTKENKEARSILRITKSRKTEKTKKAKKTYSFEDVEHLEDAVKTNGAKTEKHQQDEKELLTVFLEKCYTPHTLGSKKGASVRMKLFELALEKSIKLHEVSGENVRFLFTSDFKILEQIEKKYSSFSNRELLKLYISKSKNGHQYLDSLGGSTEISDETKYHEARVRCIEINKENFKKIREGVL